MESISLASSTDNNLALENELDFNEELQLELELGLDPSMDLNSPVLKERISELRDSVNTFMGPEFNLMMRAGRNILRDRGIDPDTAFSEGPNDLRLAMVPWAADMLDKLNQRFERHGYSIVDFYDLADTTKAARTPTGRETKGPWDDYWAQYDDDTWLTASEDDINACLGEVLGSVGGGVALV